MNTSNYSVSLSNNGADIIINEIRNECTSIHSHAESSAIAFLSNFSSRIPGLINGYRSYNHIENIFKLKSQVNAYTEELASYLQEDIRRETQDWVENQFVPMVQREITTLAQAVNAQIGDHYNQLNQLPVTLDINKKAVVNSATPSKRNRILSTGASILMGDLGGAIMGGAGGSDAMFKTLGCEFGAGIVLGIVSLFTPVGIAALVASAILSAFVGGTWALSSVEKKIRKTLIEKSRESVTSMAKKKELLNVIHSKIDSYLNTILEGVNCDMRQCS